MTHHHVPRPVGKLPIMALELAFPPCIHNGYGQIAFSQILYFVLRFVYMTNHLSIDL